VIQTHFNVVKSAHPGIRHEPRDLPVLGRAEGGSGEDIIDQGPIAWVRRPSYLDKVKHAFAVYVTGESMSPTLVAGDLVYVHPDKAYAPGSIVLIETTEGRGLIKEFQGWQGEQLWVRQYCPAKDLSFARADIKHIFTIAGTYRQPG